MNRVSGELLPFMYTTQRRRALLKCNKTKKKKKNFWKLVNICDKPVGFQKKIKPFPE